LMAVPTAVPMPTNPLVTPLLTDFYEISMCYAHFKHGRHLKPAVFELYFRKNPFHGEFTVFAGLDEAMRYIANFKFAPDDVDYLRTLLPTAEEAFFEWLLSLDCSQVQVYAIREGTVVFPIEPLIRIHGPLGISQLLETTLLNLVNFASLVTTNAARFRLSVGPEAKLLEFGCRRAQGPDGAISASRYAYTGGFDATSNVMAGKLFGLPVSGTHAHSYVQGYMSLDEVPDQRLLNGVDVVARALAWRSKLGDDESGAHDGELAAFLSYALAFPFNFLALIDTYSSIESGLKNFFCVALALKEAGYQPKGVRIDSGDLAYLSRTIVLECDKVVQAFAGTPDEAITSCLKDVQIVASNDINESVLISLKEQGHGITCFGIGTHLVTCQAQPALGCVYKLVEMSGQPCIKLSDNISKTTIPGAKAAFRIVGADGTMLLDLLAPASHEPPEVGERILCRHPFDQQKRAYVTPTIVIPLHTLVWDKGRLPAPLPTLQQIRGHVQKQLTLVRADILRTLNPTPYKISVTPGLYTFFLEIWQRNEPVRELS